MMISAAHRLGIYRLLSVATEITKGEVVTHTTQNTNTNTNPHAVVLAEEVSGERLLSAPG